MRSRLLRRPGGLDVGFDVSRYVVALRRPAELREFGRDLGSLEITDQDAALHGSWGDTPAAWLTGMTVGLVGIGIGSLTSVLGPSSRVSSGGRPGAASKIAYVLGLLAMFVVMVAVSMIVLLFGIGVGTLPVAAVLFVVAAVIAVVLVRAAGSILARDPYRVNEALNG